MEGGPCPLLASAPASESPARSSSTKLRLGTSAQGAHPRPWPLRECGSRPRELLQRRVLQGPRVWVLAGLYKIVQVGYLERNKPLSLDQPDRKATSFITSHFYHLLKARRWLKPCARSVFIYCCATSPAARSTPRARRARSAAGVRGGARPPSASSRRPRPLPSCAQPVVEGPRLLQFSVALQQQRLQVVTWVRCGTTRASAVRCGA